MTETLPKTAQKNTWLAKLKRTATCLLPIDERRRGSCKRCGACCKLPNRCPFLAFDDQGFALCKIYSFRPLNCRKYPRTAAEHITTDTCGYTFDSELEIRETSA